MTSTYVPSRKAALASLAIANRVRAEACATKREVAAGRRVAEAIADPRAASLTIEAILRAQRGWGKRKANNACARLRMSPLKRVSTLTERQVAEIGRLLLPAGKSAATVG